MDEKSTWHETLKDEDVRKNIAYNIQRYGTKKAVDAVYENQNFESCRTGDAAHDRKAIRTAIQVCNPKNKDRFNTQKYGAAVADAARDELECAVVEHVPHIKQSLERMREVDEKAAKAETLEELKKLKLKQEIHERYRSALSALAGALRVYERLPDESDAGAAQPRLNPGDAFRELPEPPESLRGSSTPGQDSE